jgi:membrane protein DedA with SNARE-associated domain
LPDVAVLGLLNFTHLVSTAGYAAIFILCVLQSCCVPTSSELTMGFAGALAAQGKLSLLGVIAVGASGEVIGAYIAWMIGRYAGRAAVDRFGRYILLSHHDLDRAEAWYDRHQRFGVLGSRLLPVIRNFVALPAGIAEVPLGRFGLLTAFGSLLWDGAWAGIGYGVGSRWHTIASGFSDVGYVLAVVVVAVLAFTLYHRYRNYVQATLQERSTGGGNGSAHLDLGERGRAGGSRPGITGGRPAHAARGRFPYNLTAMSPSPAARGEGPAASREAGSGPAGTRRWIASSSGRPPTIQPMGTVATRTETAFEPATGRWVASSSGRPLARPRRNDFPNSPIAAWEAAVVHGRKAPAERADDLLEGEAEGVEANGRLTAMLGALLLVLLAIEGVTILRISPLLAIHVVVGMVMVPVIVLKIGSTTWRFAKYYLGSPEYRRKGPPPPLLRLLGPFVVVSTVAVVATGIATLLTTTTPLRNELLLAHKVTFVLWFAAMVVHVLGHLLDVAQLAPRDFYWRTRRQIRGASLRQWAIVSAVCAGIILAVVVLPKVGPWLSGYHSVAKPVSHVHSSRPAGVPQSS